MNVYARNLVIAIAVIAVSVCLGTWGYADACKVLVVSAYHESFFRVPEINEGIEDVLGADCALTYVYLDALTEPKGVETKAQEAYLQYQAIQPDGVIAMGEEAQAFFVVPYLRDKVETPVMFNSINFPEIYEYPASNVSGISIHWPIEDSILFIRQLVPEITTIGVLFADEPAVYALIEQISREQGTYSATVLDPVVVKTAEEAVEQAAVLKAQCDALYIGPISSLLGSAGEALSSEKLLFSAIRKSFGKGTLTNVGFYVEAGLLSGVQDFGQEQGQVAAEMLQKAMSGTPLTELPITQNQFAQRMLNKTVLKEMNITPSRQVLTGVEIMETLK